MVYFLLSPAKKLAEKNDHPAVAVSKPELVQEAKVLAELMSQFAPHELASLMNISDRLARLNVERFANFGNSIQTVFPAVFLFNGDAYEGLDARGLSGDALAYLQHSLGLLSGLYGLLKPFDAIYPYRLEMGSKLKNHQGFDLYEFWGEKITSLLYRRIKESHAEVLINLASREYSRAIRFDQLPVRVISPVFKDRKNGQTRVISFYAKRARGLMVRFAAESALSSADELKAFDWEGYAFEESLSDEGAWVFVRDWH